MLSRCRCPGKQTNDAEASTPNKACGWEKNLGTTKVATTGSSIKKAKSKQEGARAERGHEKEPVSSPPLNDAVEPAGA